MGVEKGGVEKGVEDGGVEDGGDEKGVEDGGMRTKRLALFWRGNRGS